MRVSVEVSPLASDVWTVEALGSNGEICQSMFLGPDAERRAREYAAFKYAGGTKNRKALGGSAAPRSRRKDLN
jgi:hypothetical protein